MSVRFIIRRERKGSLQFAALQSPIGRDLAGTHGVDVSSLDTVVLLEGGVAYVRAEAALRIAAHLRFPWRLAGVFRILPGAARDRLYRWISGHRYRWFGRLDREWTPPAEIERRFL
jgi:predicted DCC family thiol-disulfide oxidoreductase YuxK